MDICVPNVIKLLHGLEDTSFYYAEEIEFSRVALVALAN